MPAKNVSPALRWLPLAGILAAMTVLTWIAPDERTLGAAIKPVYVHVSLTWTGMLAFLGTGILGIMVIITGRRKWADELRRLYLIALGAFSGGFLISMLASQMTWGGVPLREPRFLVSLSVLGVSLVTFVLVKSAGDHRLGGVFGMIPIIMIVISFNSSRLILHPDNPVSTAPAGIKYTFLGMFFLAILLGLWGWAELRRRSMQFAPARDLQFSHD